MTCIAYKDGVMACDGNSCDSNGMIFSSASDKASKIDGWLVGCAGDAPSCAEFKEWFKTVVKEWPKKPPEDILKNGTDTKNHFVALIVSPKGKIYYINDGNYPILLTKKFMAVGIGLELALGAMEMGASAFQAVKVAAKHCTGVGGKVQSLKLDA